MLSTGILLILHHCKKVVEDKSHYLFKCPFLRNNPGTLLKVHLCKLFCMIKVVLLELENVVYLRNRFDLNFILIIK